MWESASNHRYCSNPIEIILASRQLRLIIEARHRWDGVQLAKEETEWEAERGNGPGLRGNKKQTYAFRQMHKNINMPDTLQPSL